MAIQPEEIVIEAPTEPIAEPPIIEPPPVVSDIPPKPLKDKEEEKVSRVEAKLQIDSQKETIDQLQDTIQSLLDVKRLEAMGLAISSNTSTDQLVKLAEEIYAFLTSRLLTNGLTVK